MEAVKECAWQIIAIDEVIKDLAANGDRDCSSCPRTLPECDDCEVKIQEEEELGDYDDDVIADARVFLEFAGKLRYATFSNYVFEYPKHSTPEFDYLLDVVTMVKHQYETAKKKNEELAKAGKKIKPVKKAKDDEKE